MTNAQELLERLNLMGVRINITPPGKLQIDAPKGVLTVTHRELLQSHRTALIELVSRGTGNFPYSVAQPERCPYCTSKLSIGDCAALAVRFCPLGCAFVWQSFADWEAAYALAEKMFKVASYDECAAMSETLSEREAVMMYENNLTPEHARLVAEADLFPRWLDEHRLRSKFKSSEFSG